MSQHDYDIANASGADVRADLNDVLEAIATSNSGSSEPTVKFANQWWFDTSNNVLKNRNNANTAWVNVAAKDGSGWRPYFNGTELATPSTAEAEAGTATTPRLWPAERVKEAIDALSADSITSESSQSLSGSSVDFTGLPSGLDRITIEIYNASTDGTGNIIVQIGDSDGFLTSSYFSGSSNGSSVATSSSSLNMNGGQSTEALTGHMVLTRLNSNNWISSHSCIDLGSTNRAVTGAGRTASGALSNELDRIRITTTSGSFATGTVNVKYETGDA